jgi:prevent-host-death family protein
MRTVTSCEANRSFSRLLGEAECGESMVITRRGRPVAILSPLTGTASAAERQAAIERLVATMREGLPIGNRRFTRDEMHER